MSDAFIISGLKIYSEQGILNQASIEISNGQIKNLGSLKSQTKKILEFPATYHLVPGFIDLHVHGANGCDVMDASAEALATIRTALAAEGVTGFLATTMTAKAAHIESAVSVAGNYISNSLGAKILGIHLEGPFISSEKAGAQNRENILPLQIDYVRQWQQASKNNIKIVTLAPELPGSTSFIRELKQLGIVAAMGHTNATYAESIDAIKSGCSHVTHLFNAMRGIHQREPGVVTAALLSDVNVELIVDGVHVHPALVELTLKMKGKDKLVLVTDAMRAKCLQDGNYELGGQSVDVKNTIARLSDGTLAGSTLKMSSAIKNIIKFTQCDLIDAIEMASENPAKILKLFDKKGSIAVGKDADLVVLDEDFNVVMTVVEGRPLCRLGVLKDKISIANDFDAPLSDGLLSDFEK